VLSYRSINKFGDLESSNLLKPSQYSNRQVITGPLTHSVGARLVMITGVWRLSASSVTRRICNVTHHGAARGGPVVLRPVKATPCFTRFIVIRPMAVISVRRRTNPIHRALGTNHTSGPLIQFNWH